MKFEFETWKRKLHDPAIKEIAVTDYILYVVIIQLA
jgi:hypothetical protein